MSQFTEKKGPKAGIYGPKKRVCYSISERVHEAVQKVAKVYGMSASTWIEQQALQAASDLGIDLKIYLLAGKKPRYCAPKKRKKKAFLPSVRTVLARQKDSEKT